MIKVVKIYDTQDNTSHLENKQVLFSNNKDFLNRNKGVFEIYHGIKNNKHIGYSDDFWGYDYIAEIECDCKFPFEPLEKCDSCNKEFERGETYSVMNYHEHCIPKKELKVYHAANCEEAGHLIFSEVEWFRPKYNSWEKTTLLKIKNLDIYDEVLNGTNCFRLKSINSSGYFDVSIIRECEQPEEKVREVTIEDVREKFIERYVSKNVFLSEEKDHACVKIDKIDFCCGLDNLFGEKVVVKND